MLEIKNIETHFRGLLQPALSIAKMQIMTGEKIALRGPSGCGKTSFVNLITGLLKPTNGTVMWDDTNIYAMNEGKRDQWRGNHIGLVMQDFHLFSGLTALENVLLPLSIAKIVKKTDYNYAKALLSRVGILDTQRDIRTMSRGEMQRIAIARALLRKPAILIADEPTASLDYENGIIIGDLLIELANETNATLILITHDHTLYERLPHRLEMERGQIIKDNLNQKNIMPEMVQS